MEKTSKEKLWEAYLKISTIQEYQKRKLAMLGKLFFEDVSYLYKIYSLVGNTTEKYENSKLGVIYDVEGDSHILRKGAEGIVLKEMEMKQLLMDMITLFEDILPLGSVVDLKKEKLAAVMDLSQVEKIRVVITKRFLGASEGCYYPYGAVLYPIGIIGEGRVISFTPAMIEKVIHTGYADEMEEVFVFQMKYQLNIEQRRKSAGFASPDELAELEQMTRKMGETNGRNNTTD